MISPTNSRSLHHDRHLAAIENFADDFQRRGWLQCLEAIRHRGADRFPKRTNAVLDPDKNIRFIQQDRPVRHCSRTGTWETSAIRIRLYAVSKVSEGPTVTTLPSW